MIALLVSIKIKPDQRQKFIEAAEDDSISSVRDEGGGCLRFDVLHDQEDENHFFFYEIYRDAEAHQKHSTYPHYARWSAARDQVIAEPITRSLCTVLFPKDYR